MQVKDLQYYMTVYAFNLAKRKTAAQRRSFFRIVGNIFTNFGYDCKLQTKKQAGNTIQHFIAGDLEKADTVYMGIYDNPTRMLLPRPRYYPLDMRKNKTAEILNVSLHLLLIVWSVVLLAGVLFFTRAFHQTLRTFLVAGAAIGLIALYSVTAGKPAYPNLSRNAALALMTMVASKGGERTAYVLCDMASASILGFQVLLEENPALARKQIIVLDSLGEDETLVIAANDRMRYGAQKLKDRIKDPASEVVIPDPDSYSVLSLFPNAILLSFCHGDDRGEYHVENLRTKRDDKVDMERLQGLCQGL